MMSDVKVVERECNECGEVKPDVEFRTWDGIDAAEWDIICVGCLGKKEREMRCFWVFLISFVSTVFAAVLFFAYVFIVAALS